jgi:hypothetical protein
MFGLTKGCATACRLYRAAQYSGLDPGLSPETPRVSCSDLDVAALHILQSCHSAKVKTPLPTGSAVATLAEGSGMANRPPSRVPHLSTIGPLERLCCHADANTGDR